MCLISDEDASQIVWCSSDQHASQIADENDDDDAGRLFTFQVAKTNEQEENVNMREGFTVSTYRLMYFDLCSTQPVGSFQSG